MAALDAVLDKIDADFESASSGCSRCRDQVDLGRSGLCRRLQGGGRIWRATSHRSASRPRCGRPPAIRWSSPKAKAARPRRPHVLFYGHYDVQPVDPLNLWQRRRSNPRIVDAADGPADHRRARRRGRQGPADDLRRSLPRLEGSHGACPRHHHPDRGRGGNRLDVAAGFPRRNKDELKADFALVCDTGMWDRDTPAITTMLRGLRLEEVEIKAANRDLHSGMFGGAAVNPIQVLARNLGGPARRRTAASPCRASTTA